MKKKSFKVALFRCCNTHSCLPHNEKVMMGMLDKLDVEAIHIKEFNCCGYPLRNINFNAYLLSSARNLAIAEKKGLDIITFCSCCYGSLKSVNHLMQTDDCMRNRINESLAAEDLNYRGTVTVSHCLEYCYSHIGMDRLKIMITQSLKGLKVATHYGCQMLRPHKIVGFDDPLAPSIFDQLVELTGAESVAYPNHYMCCGASVCGVDADLSMDLAQRKIRAAFQSGADLFCTVCANCQIQFDKVQKIIVLQREPEYILPAISFAQLFGMSLGIDRDFMGFDHHEFDVRDMLNNKLCGH